MSLFHPLASPAKGSRVEGDVTNLTVVIEVMNCQADAGDGTLDPLPAKHMLSPEIRLQEATARCGSMCLECRRSPVQSPASLAKGCQVEDDA